MVRAIYCLPSELSATPEAALGLTHFGCWQMCQGSPWAERTHLVSQGENKADHRDLWTLTEYSCPVRGLVVFTLMLSIPREEICLCLPVLTGSSSPQNSLWSWERCLHTLHDFGISPPRGNTGIFAYEETMTWGVSAMGQQGLEPLMHEVMT